MSNYQFLVAIKIVWKQAVESCRSSDELSGAANASDWSSSSLDIPAGLGCQ